MLTIARVLAYQWLLGLASILARRRRLATHKDGLVFGHGALCPAVLPAQFLKKHWPVAFSPVLWSGKASKALVHLPENGHCVDRPDQAKRSPDVPEGSDMSVKRALELAGQVCASHPFAVPSALPFWKIAVRLPEGRIEQLLDCLPKYPALPKPTRYSSV